MAEREPDRFHGIGPFDPETGENLRGGSASFSAVFGQSLCQLAEQDGRICAITAAMQSGTGLDEFARRFPARFFDVGITEGHAVSMAGGMAKQLSLIHISVSALTGLSAARISVCQGG